MNIIDLNDSCECHEHTLMRLAETQGIMIGLHYARSIVKDEPGELTDETINRIRQQIADERTVKLEKVHLKLVDSSTKKKEDVSNA